MPADAVSDDTGKGSSVLTGDNDRETTGIADGGHSGGDDNPESTSASNVSDTTVLRNLGGLYCKCLIERQKHLLAGVYFSKRDTWLIFGPVTFLTLVSGLLAFLASSAIFESSQEQLTLIVGCISILCVFIQSISKHTRYATKSEMHRSAASELKKLCDNLGFHAMNNDLGITDTPSHDVKKDGEITESEDVEAGKVANDDSGNVKSSTSNADKFEKHETLFKQVTEACESKVPLQIEQAYSLLVSRWHIATSNTSNTDTVDFRNALKYPSEYYRMLNWIALHNELHSIISNAFGWPWLTLKPDVAVNRAIVKYLRTSEIFLAGDIKLDEDIGILCFSTFCFCLDATGWFWKCCRDGRKKERKERRAELKLPQVPGFSGTDVLCASHDDAQDQLSQQEIGSDHMSYGSIEEAKES